MLIVALYAALLAILFVYLSIRVIGVRRRAHVAIGDGGHPELARAMRVHANFAEYVPLTLLLLFFVEGAGAPPLALHALGLLLVLGRAAHAYGVSESTENFRFRVGGMTATFSTILLSAGYLLLSPLFA